MGQCLQDRFSQFETVFFDTAAAMQDYCEIHLADTILVALDHDLELQPRQNGRCFDPGTGRQVADYLASRKPACSVVIHTSNGPAVDGMEMTLRDAHWVTYRVVPADDLQWIPTTWFRTVRRGLRLAHK